MAIETRLRRSSASTQRLVYRFARQMSGCAATADDVTQDVFVALMRNSRHFDPAMGALSTYLYAMARRMVRRRLVWRSRQVPIDQETPETRGRGR